MKKFFTALLGLIPLYCYHVVPAQAQAQDVCAEYRIAQEDLMPEIAASDPIPYSDSLLWRISKEGTPPSHLFGTIHVDSTRLLQFPQAIKHAFSNSTTLVVELKPTPQDAAIARRAMLIRGKDTVRLNELLPKEMYHHLERVLYQELPGMRGALPHFQPWAIYLLLHQQLLQLKNEKQTGHVLDFYLQEKLAPEHQLQVRALESLEEQLEVLSSISLEDQLLLLQETVCNMEAIRGVYAEMLELYLAGNMAKLTIIGLTSTYPEDQVEKRASYENFMEKLIHLRNQRMAERLLPYLKQGRIFIAVGALHLPGAGGLVDRLMQAGYTVRPIPVRWTSPPQQSVRYDGVRFVTASAPTPALLLPAP